MASNKKYMDWNDAVHNDVLISMVDVLKPSNAQWNEVIKQLKALGYTFSASALKYAFSCCTLTLLLLRQHSLLSRQPSFLPSFLSYA
ncbi:hypothetical protein F5Y15DRAFT_375682 [Xylariaceae sp. FL0016]|nr:hypothetical protein F5Y15DRAFT_375682 [Xylariaceae sp. FL0016]